MNSRLKNASPFLLGIAINSYIIHQVLVENAKLNRYLSELPKVELEKLRARDWYLRQLDPHFGCVMTSSSIRIVLDKSWINRYDALPEKQKKLIHTKYRWHMFKTHQAKNDDPPRETLPAIKCLRRKTKN